ncbi:GPALPP motifs-containing protein 1-like protein [Abortiporus biennis]
MIGPEIPAHILQTRRSVTPFDDNNSDQEQGPSPPEPQTSIGPAIPPQLLNSSTTPPPSKNGTNSKQPEEEEEEEDDYVPALPPDLLAARSGPQPQPQGPKRPVAGPSFPPSIAQHRQKYDDDDDDDDYGPQPLPAGVVVEQSDGVREFLEKEERRRKLIEEAAKPKALKREEWMLVPPSSSDLLGSIDPTKLNKPRQFARSAAPQRNVDTTLWTETPAERQQRLADEVSGKRRRIVNADPDSLADEDHDARKKRRKEEEVRRGVEEYTRKNRGGALVEQHSSKLATDPKDKEEGPPVIWDHSRDMGVGGRLMDDKTRDKFIKEARGLGDRFGTGRSGGFL